MSMSALTEKLIVAQAAEKQEVMLTFTRRFSSYLLLSFGSSNVSSAATLEDWQKVQDIFTLRRVRYPRKK